MTVQIVSELTAIWDNAVAILHSSAVWETKYDLIFSKAVSIRVQHLDPGFSYYDPDTTYEEDCRAFVQALQDRVAELQKVFANV